jgi:hypothetical protein
MSMKNSSDTIGNRTRDVPACNAVFQQTAYPKIRFLEDNNPSIGHQISPFYGAPKSNKTTAFKKFHQKESHNLPLISILALSYPLRLVSQVIRFFQVLH